jgi:hypothetical protein
MWAPESGTLVIGSSNPQREAGTMPQAYNRELKHKCANAGRSFDPFDTRPASNQPLKRVQKITPQTLFVRRAR